MAIAYSLLKNYIETQNCGHTLCLSENLCKLLSDKLTRSFKPFVKNPIYLPTRLPFIPLPPRQGGRINPQLSRQRLLAHSKDIL